MQEDGHLRVIRYLLEDVCRDILSTDEVETFFQPHLVWRYKAAFTHKSANPERNYEILELKGDSALNYVTSIYVRKRFPDVVSHVWLTNIKQTLISARYLSQIGERLGLCSHLIASQEVVESLKEAHSKESIIDDLFESTLGAVCRVADLELCHGTGHIIVYHIITKMFDKFPIHMRWTDLVHPISIIKEVYDATPDVNGVKVEWKHQVSYTLHKNESYDDPWRAAIYYPFRTNVRMENSISHSYGKTEQEALQKAVKYAISSRNLRDKVRLLAPDPFVLGKKMFPPRSCDSPRGISQWEQFKSLGGGFLEMTPELPPEDSVENPQQASDSFSIEVPESLVEMVRGVLTEAGMERSAIKNITGDLLAMRRIACSCVASVLSTEDSVRIIHELSLYEGVGVIDSIVIDHILTRSTYLTEWSVNNHKQNIMSHDNFNELVPEEFKNMFLSPGSSSGVEPERPRYSKERINVLFKAFLGCLSATIDKKYVFGIGYRMIHAFFTKRLSSVDLMRDESIGSLSRLFAEMKWGSVANSCEYSQEGRSFGEGRDERKDEETCDPKLTHAAGCVHVIKIFGFPHNRKVQIGEGRGKNKKQAMQIAAKCALHTLKTKYSVVTKYRTRTTKSSFIQREHQRDHHQKEHQREHQRGYPQKIMRKTFPNFA